jgi:hypothetical protein
MTISPERLEEFSPGADELRALIEATSAMEMAGSGTRERPLGELAVKADASIRSSGRVCSL